jgi:peptidase E
VFLDNTVSKEKAKKKHEKLDKCNVLLITGGNTFELLHNLRRNGFDEKIKDFSKREDTIMASFSAGAIVLGPTLRLLNSRWRKLRGSNKVGIKDLECLSIVKEEVFPHYGKNDEKALEEYKKKYNTEVITLKDYDFLVV